MTWWNGLDYRWTRVVLVLNGLLLSLAYPKALYSSELGWVWDVPGRNHPMENMIVAVYVTMGLFLIWSSRNPLRALPLIDFVIVSGLAHASVMWFDAAHIPAEHEHLMLGGDVFGTYIAPVSLMLVHPKRLYLWASQAAGSQG